MIDRHTARRALAAASVALVLSVAGCGSQAAEAPTAPVTERARPTDREAYIAAGPGAFDPRYFAHGDFVGAIDMQYSGDRSSATAQEADAKYKEYFKGNYTPPQPGERSVIRLNAMGDPRDGDRLLFKGAIVDNITLPTAVVMGLHNITEIEGGVELNGEVFEGRVAGANGSLAIGDTLTVWVPDAFYPDLVDRFVYQVVPGDGGGDYDVVDVGPGFEDIIYRASPSEDVYQLTLYTCWPPNQSIRRLVTRFHLIESSIEVGSVSPVDA